MRFLHHNLRERDAAPPFYRKHLENRTRNKIAFRFTDTLLNNNLLCIVIYIFARSIPIAVAHIEVNKRSPYNCIYIYIYLYIYNISIYLYIYNIFFNFFLYLYRITF